MLWQINQKSVVVIVVGTLAYGALWGLEFMVSIPNLLFISLRPSVAIPIFCGLIWGPIVGFVVGAVGVFWGDFIVTGLDFPWYYDLSAGLLGLVAGFAMLMLRKAHGWRYFLLVEAWSLAAVFVSVLVSTGGETIFAGAQFIFGISFVNLAVSALIFVPILTGLDQRIDS